MVYSHKSPGVDWVFPIPGFICIHIFFNNLRVSP